MERLPIVIILNDIRSAWNVGAIFRTADAILAEKIYITGYTATPLHPKVPKTSLGAEDTVPWEQQDDAKEVIQNLKIKGYKIVGLEIDKKAKNFWEVKHEYPVALLLGNEIHGITEEFMDVCDEVIYIPMLGTKESLNVATAAGIAVFEIAKPLILGK